MEKQLQNDASSTFDIDTKNSISAYGTPGSGDVFIKAPENYQNLSVLGRGGSFLLPTLFPEGYFNAALLVLDKLASSNSAGEKDSLIYPALFNFRHYLELTIKDSIYNFTKKKRRKKKCFFSFCKNKKNQTIKYPYGHKLKPLWKKLKSLIPDFPSDSTDDTVDKLIKELDKLDKNSMTFRYVFQIAKPKDTKNKLIINEAKDVDVENLKIIMCKLYNYFEGISCLSYLEDN
jgi:hypothetical protein